MPTHTWKCTSKYHHRSSSFGLFWFCVFVRTNNASIPHFWHFRTNFMYILILYNYVQEGCKFLIFAHHQSMIEAIHTFLQVRSWVFFIKIVMYTLKWYSLSYFQKKKVECIRIDGSTPAASRQALVTDFQEKESVKAAVVLLLNIWVLLYFYFATFLRPFIIWLLLSVIHQSWRRWLNINCCKHSDICRIILDSWGHRSSRGSCS